MLLAPPKTPSPKDSGPPMLPPQSQDSDPPPKGWRRQARRPVVLGALALLILLWALSFLPRFRIPFIQAPEPEVVLDEDWTPPLPPSRLSVPVVADLSGVLADLEKVVPAQHGSLEDRIEVPDNDRLEIAFALQRSPFEAELQGTVAHVSSIISYRGQVWYNPPVLPTVSASCATGEDEPAPRALIEMSAQLSISPEWSLVSEPRVERVTPLTDTDRDRCRLTVFDFDVTERVMNGARNLIEGKIPEIKEALESIDLKSRFEEWWQILDTPIELADEVWLVVGPEAVAKGEMSGSGTILTATTVLTARPQLVLGPRPVPSKQPLPNLTEASDSVGGLTIRAIAEADYATTSQKLTDELGGQTFEQSGHTITIEKLELSGIGARRVALEVELSGAARGRVFLVGTPEYDHQEGQVYVPDLEFDVATINVLVGGLDWVAHRELVEFLRARARWPTADLTKVAADYLTQGLNSELSEGVRLEGKVDAVRILGVHPTREALIIHAAADATAVLIVTNR